MQLLLPARNALPSFVKMESVSSILPHLSQNVSQNQSELLLIQHLSAGRKNVPVLRRNIMMELHNLSDSEFKRECRLGLW